MAHFRTFGGMVSGDLTPTPLVLCQSNESQRSMDAWYDAPAESGLPTPRFNSREVNLETLRKKLHHLQRESERCFQEMGMGPPPGLATSLDANVPMNIQLPPQHTAGPYTTFSAMPAPPLPHPEPRFVHMERAAPAPRTNLAKSQQQLVSKGSVGHPVKCAPACRYVKRKGGCKDGADCSLCHHCLWSKAGSNAAEESLSGEDVRVREAKTLANKLVLLLGGEEPFGSKQAQETTKPEISLGTMGHPQTCAEPCKYLRRKGGCTYGKACKYCHACPWSRSSRQEANASYCIGASYDDAMKDCRDSGINYDALIEEPYAAPVLPMNPARWQTQAFPQPRGTWSRGVTASTLDSESSGRGPNPREPFTLSSAFPQPQGVPYEVPWCASIGSMGHPYNCGPACKYAMKAKGCKDGSMCDHCHLCRWVRYNH